jgi:hypothetical protein
MRQWRLRTFDLYRRAMAVHKQWLATYRQTNDPRHLATATAMQEVAQQLRARLHVEQGIERIQRTRHHEHAASEAD